VTRLLEYAHEALAALWRNRTRTVLTMLGMIIGTSSVIAVFGISRASASGIAATIESFGVPAAFLQPDPTQNFPELADIQYRDIAQLRAATQGMIDDIEPLYTNNYTVRAGNITGVESVQSIGAYAPADRIPMREGRKIDAQEVADAARVTTLTYDLADKYFPNGNAVGGWLSINGSRYEVVGVYAPISGSLFNSLAGTGQIYIPYTTFHRIVPGPVTGLLIYPTDPNNADAALAAVKSELQHIHTSKAQYLSQSGTSALGIFQNVLNIIAAGLSAIGAVALVVAGIGIMNIMLVSVVERTREIGIRKSIGASRADIALQFLMESVILSILGGGTGMVLGLLATVGAAAYISQQLGAAIVPYLLLVCIAIAFSIGIGMAFGLYPAIRAARLDPVEALRS
jgi:putative ABC transport system permease protein